MTAKEMMVLSSVQGFCRRFRRAEQGAATVFGLYMFVVGVMVLGLALDRANGWRVRTQLQVANDAAVLAAAANLDDIDFARSLALETARRNVADPDIITEGDIRFGNLDPDTLEFVVGADEDGAYSAVAATAGRTEERGNSVATLLMSFVGINSLDVNVGSIAIAANVEGQDATCHDALFLSTSIVETGGGNQFNGEVCVHGADFIRTGGGDFFNEQVRFTSPNENNINLNSFSPSTLEAEDLIGERTLQPMFLGQLSAMRTSIFDDLWISQSEDPTIWGQQVDAWGNLSGPVIGEYEIDLATYDGILPSFLFDSAGKARVEMRESFVTYQPDDLEEYTIYLSTQGLQFAGGVDIEHAAFVTQGGIGIGGGQLHFDDVYFLASQFNSSGNVAWGDPTDPCDVEYGVYIFSTGFLGLGGWASSNTVGYIPGTSFAAGVIAAAPNLNPGGGMRGTGIYMETHSQLNLGGSTRITGCALPRTSDVPLSDVSFAGEPVLAGALLHR